MTDRAVLARRAKPTGVTPRAWWHMFWNVMALTMLVEGAAVIAYRMVP